MKRIIVLIAAALLCLPATAQHFDPEHRHAIEISTGIPPIHTFMLGSGTNYRIMNGVSEQHKLRTCINIGYTYAINEKWDFNFIVDLAQDYYTQTFYPKIQDESENNPYPKYDKNGEPVDVKNGVNLWPSYMFDFRWKWYRSDSVRLYSSFGLSYLPFEWPIFPNLTPIGINVGGNHFYGVAEMSLSTAATLLLVGAGYRF